MSVKDTPIFEKKNVLVTGGAGFLGSHLCERLLGDAKVICMDDFSNSNIHNIEHLLQYPDFEFIKYDVTQPIDLSAFEELEKFRVRYQGVQEIYHLACPTSPKNFQALKLHSLWANSRAMLSTLDLAATYRATYLFASSSVIYGPPKDTGHIFHEEDLGTLNHLSPRACYDEGKRFAETCVETYREVKGINAKIVRIFTTYGPRMRLRDGLFIPDFIINAIEGKDLVIYGDGAMTQTFCFVSDIIDGLIRSMRSDPAHSVFNLGHDQPRTVQEAAEMILSLTGSSSRIVYEEPLEFLTAKGIPDLHRAKEMLDWIPVIGLEEGLKRTIDYTVAKKEMFVLD